MLHKHLSVCGLLWQILLFALIVLMRQIQHVEEFAFPGALHNIVDSSHGIAAVYHDQLVGFSFQHGLDNGFSKSTQIGMGRSDRTFQNFPAFPQGLHILRQIL